MGQLSPLLRHHQIGIIQIAINQSDDAVSDESRLINEIYFKIFKYAFSSK